mmetsp:Transcript_23825/g.69781  ORF Transcript_23825/g.69781 Transcript_23825/m.69781 type:complete len:329 (-) Transcript_23825:49-1035(-)
MANFLRGVREWATPTLKESAFLERGVLTPEEFVAAGDQLVFRCPTWAWESGDPSRLKSHLPKDKQFLVTRRVPCRNRVASLTEAAMHETEEGDEWMATHLPSSSNPEAAAAAAAAAEEYDDIEDLSAAAAAAPPLDGSGLAAEVGQLSLDAGGQTASATGSATGADEFQDIDDLEEEGVAAADAATVAAGGQGSGGGAGVLLKTRTYDITITYDKYYQTPRFWLFGYSEEGQPLSNQQVFEDIMPDYVKRTVTIDPHPHLGIPHASVHPCKHANVMKQIVDSMCEGGAEPRTDQYLFIFLKFINSVVPTIEYDFTMEVSLPTSQQAAE